MCSNFDIDLLVKQLNEYNSSNISDKEKLDLLLTLSKEIDNEIKSISTNGVDSYTSLLRLKLAGIVFGHKFESEREILWSPDKYAEYERLRRKISEEVGSLGKTITKSQYEDAIMILNKFGYS